MADKQISYNGTTHSFPGDFSDDEISSALAEYDKPSTQARGVGAEEGSGAMPIPGMEKLGGTPPAVGKPKLEMKKTMLIGGGSDAPDEQDNESTGRSVANVGAGMLKSGYGVSAPGILQSLTGAKTPAMVKRVAPWVEPVPKDELAGEIAMQGGLAMVGALGEGGAELPTRAVEGRAAAAAEPAATGAARLAKSAAPGPNVGLEIAKRLPYVGKYVRMADWGRKLLSPEPAAVPEPEVPAHWGQSNVGPVEMWGRSVPKGQERVTAGAPVARPAPAWQQREAASKLQRAEPIPSNNFNGMKGGEEPPPSSRSDFDLWRDHTPQPESEGEWADLKGGRPEVFSGHGEEYKSMPKITTTVDPHRLVALESNLTDNASAEEYADRWEAGSEPPPVDVWRNRGEFFLGDGHHRATAAGMLKREVPATVRFADVPGGTADTAEDTGIRQRLEGQQESERAGADEIERKLFFMGNKPEGYTPKTLSLYDGQEKAVDVPLSKEEAEAIYKGQQGGRGGAPPDEPTSGGGGGAGGEGRGGGTGSSTGNITPEPGQRGGGGIIDRLKKFNKDEEGSMVLPTGNIFRGMKSGPMSGDTATPILRDMVKNSQAQRFFPKGLDGAYDPSDVLIDPEYKGIERFSPDEIKSMTPVQEYVNPAIVNRYMDAIREGGDVSADSVYKKFEDMPDPRQADAAIKDDWTLQDMQPDVEPHITEDLTGRRVVMNGTHRSIASYKSDKPLDMSVYRESGELIPDSARRVLGNEGVPSSEVGDRGGSMLPSSQLSPGKLFEVSPAAKKLKKTGTGRGR